MQRHTPRPKYIVKSIKLIQVRRSGVIGLSKSAQGPLQGKKKINYISIYLLQFNLALILFFFFVKDMFQARGKNEGQ